MSTKRVVFAVAVLVLTSNLACKKSVDPNAFDGGAPPVATVAAPVAAEVPDAAAPLAALSAPTAAPVIKKAPPKDGGVDAAVAAAPTSTAASPANANLSPQTIAACNNARTTCGSPKVGTDAKLKKLCDAFTAECRQQGGSI